MSKVTNELHKASQERELKRSEQWDEVRRWEANLAARTAARPAEPAIAPAAKGQAPAVAASAQKTPPAATPETWQQTFDACQAQVMELERLASAAQHRLEAAQGQVDAKTHTLAQLQRDVEAAKHDAANAAGDRAAVAQRLQAAGRRLEALRECQHLAQALRMSEDQLQSATQMAARLEEARAKLSEELAASKRRSDELHTLVEQSRSRLGHALTRAQEPS